MYVDGLRVANVIVFAVVVLAVLVGTVFLQVFLSKKESKWPGLVLPGVSLLFSLLAALSIVLFLPVALETTIMVDGVIHQQTTNFADTGSVIMSAAMTFLVMSVPTIILFAIYAACRNKLKRQKDLGRMSVQDLG
jgi:hypothetical protein